MVEREQEHRSPEATPARPGGDGGQPDQRRRVKRPVAVVLSEPDRVEPGRLGSLALADGLREIAACLERAQAELHGEPLAAGAIVTRAVPLFQSRSSHWLQADDTAICRRAAALERRPAHSRRAAMAAVADVLAIPAAHGRRLRGTDAPSLPAIARYSTISWPWRCGIGCARGTLGRGARASRRPLPGLEQGRNYGEALLTDRSGAADLGADPGRLCGDAVDDVRRLVADAGPCRIPGPPQGCRVRGRPRRLLRGQSHQTQPEGIRSDG